MSDRHPARTRRIVDRIAGVTGGLLLVWLLYDTGFNAVGRCLGRMGAGATLAVVPYVVASLCDACGWRTVLAAVSAARVSFTRLWLVRLAGEAVNSVAPTGIGGEPLKVLLLRSHGVPGSEAAAAVVVSRTGVTVTQSLLVVAGITALLGRFGWGWEVPAALVLLLALVAALLLVLVWLQQSGPVQIGTRLLQRILPGSRFVTRISGRAAAVDGRLAAFYRSQRASFVVAGCWHLIGWVASASEVWLLFRLMGVSVSCSDALIIEGLAQPIRATGVLVPGALGTQESGGVAVCCWLGIPRDVSVAVWLVRRARELLFDGLGLLYLVATGARAAARSPGQAAPQGLA